MEIRRAEVIFRDLEQMILTGAFGDGERLDEIRLAQKFGVSRTPLREAFQRLSVSGLVEQIPRRGVFVRQPGPMELLESFEYMAEIEAACGRLAAKRISDDAIADLEQANLKCQSAIKAADVSAYYGHNASFHQIIYVQSGNRPLQEEALRLQKRLKPYRRMQLQFRGRLEQSMKEHKMIVRALKEGASEEAANLLRDHVAIQGEKFHHLMAEIRSSEDPS
ncbi:GntR family transcriptional regulator [Rhodophyticola sp. CCM32]|uniref:GntR family transcriptional regulator n=1 Tax=Rhodophyticola sp. CCM32 TaxID=2916397 RepID=UPI00107F74CC|nr:GntR family transcriptional regulator [Rhodophyticola sp. CCM32]QBX99920.1 GntR family transcriptional regulator [Rhodophyticola sp. CCM32]